MSYRICSCGRKISKPSNTTIWPKRCGSCDLALKSKKVKKIKSVADKPVRKSGNTSLKLANKKLDEAWSLLIKLRAGYKCEYCGSSHELNSHHIYSRANFATRWLPENGICLCVSHHTFSNKFSAHRTPIEFTQWLETVKGADFIQSLKFEANSVRKMNIYDKIELLEKLKAEIKSFQPEYQI